MYLSSILLFRYVIFLVVISFAKIRIITGLTKSYSEIISQCDSSCSSGRPLSLCVSRVAVTLWAATYSCCATLLLGILLFTHELVGDIQIPIKVKAGGFVVQVGTGLAFVEQL